MSDVSLREFVEALMNERFRSRDELRQQDQKALKLQAEEYERRLDELNHAHDEARRVLGTYVTKTAYDKDQEAFRELRDRVNVELADRTGWHKGISIVISVIAALIAGLAFFFGHAHAAELPGVSGTVAVFHADTLGILAARPHGDDLVHDISRLHRMDGRGDSVFSFFPERRAKTIARLQFAPSDLGTSAAIASSSGQQPLRRLNSTRDIFADLLNASTEHKSCPRLALSVSLRAHTELGRPEYKYRRSQFDISCSSQKRSSPRLRETRQSKKDRGVASVLPNLEVTPGLARDDLSQDQICNTRWGKDKRHVTAAMKRKVFENYGLTGNLDPSCRCKRHMEIDHLVSRELGGEDVVENLWPQCYCGPWNAVQKDRVENRLHKEVCAGNLTLKQAQKEIRSDWRVPYRRYFGEP